MLISGSPAYKQPFPRYCDPNSLILKPKLRQSDNMNDSFLNGG